MHLSCYSRAHTLMFRLLSLYVDSTQILLLCWHPYLNTLALTLFTVNYVLFYVHTLMR